MAIRTKQDATGVLASVADDKRFFCRDGCVCENLTKLMGCFNHMTQDVFNYHVTDDKNDFSKWVRDILGDRKLANDLMHVASAAEAERLTKARILWLRREV